MRKKVKWGPTDQPTDGPTKRNGWVTSLPRNNSPLPNSPLSNSPHRRFRRWNNSPPYILSLSLILSLFIFLFLFIWFSISAYTTRLNKKAALLNDKLSYWISKKLIKILDHLKALEKIFHLAPIWYCYLFSFRNGISLSKNIAYFSFATPMKKMHFSKIVLLFAEL